VYKKGGIKKKMKKLLRSMKALSPVVATIILLAVTVAVSIAVAAWMGALTFTFMGGSENLNVGYPWGWTLAPSTNDYVYVNVTNNGGGSIILNTIRIGSTQCLVTPQNHSDTGTPLAWPLTLSAGEMAGLKITYTGKDFTAGVPYTITIVTAANHEFTTQGTPPG
jgi:flagellin-like protein